MSLFSSASDEPAAPKLSTRKLTLLHLQLHSLQQQLYSNYAYKSWGCILDRPVVTWISTKMVAGTAYRLMLVSDSIDSK